MPRAKKAPAAHARHKKMLSRAKGYRQGRSKLYRRAKEFVEKGLTYAFRDRRRKKRDFRQLWIARISAACRTNGVSYSVFMNSLKTAGIDLNRKVLADMAFSQPDSFVELVRKVCPQPQA